MIQMQSVLDVADNTGARSVMCIKGDGISIADVDMVEDGRRLRGANV